jgi:hypothetical protein
MVRNFLIFIIVCTITLGALVGCKTTEQHTTTDDVDYSATPYDFKPDVVIEAEYE